VCLPALFERDSCSLQVVERLAGYGDFLLGGVHCAVAERAVSGAFGNLQPTSHPTREGRIRSESPSTAWVRSSGGPASFGPTFPRVAGKSTTTGDPCPDRTGVPH